MHSNLFMYLTAMSAVSIHNLVNNINEVAKNYDQIELKTSDTNWTLTDKIASIFPLCNGTKQSPINIETQRVIENMNLRLGLTAYDKPISGFLVNQFPTFQLVPFSYEYPRPSALVSNSLARSFNPYADSHFTLNHVQFYWSQDEAPISSVHQMDNQSYPLELHFVHLNTAYSTLEEALTKPDGLLILAVVAVPSTHESYVLDRLLDDLSNLTLHGQRAIIDEDSTWRSFLPADTSRFYRYQGSMVLPPCHESVQWIIFEDKLKLGQKQLRRLRKYKFTAKKFGVEVNWSAQRRPMQKLHNRVVERSFSLRSSKRDEVI